MDCQRFYNIQPLACILRHIYTVRKHPSSSFCYIFILILSSHVGYCCHLIFCFRFPSQNFVYISFQLKASICLVYLPSSDYRCNIYRNVHHFRLLIIVFGPVCYYLLLLLLLLLLLRSKLSYRSVCRYISYCLNFISMWSIPLCYFNNGNNNRKASQTQLQYCIGYTMGGGYMFRPLRGHLYQPVPCINLNLVST
jgi:FlaA1/EpsC-like NDP-sugar epimerase